MIDAQSIVRQAISNGTTLNLSAHNDLLHQLASSVQQKPGPNQLVARAVQEQEMLVPTIGPRGISASRMNVVVLSSAMKASTKAAASGRPTGTPTACWMLEN